MSSETASSNVKRTARSQTSTFFFFFFFLEAYILAHFVVYKADGQTVVANQRTFWTCTQLWEVKKKL